MKTKIFIIAIAALCLILSSCGKDVGQEKPGGTGADTAAGVSPVSENKNDTALNEGSNDTAETPESKENTDNAEDYKMYGITKIWAEYIDGKLEAVPEGKSFIYVTDTHWNESSKDGGWDLTTSLMAYAKDKLGIKTVLHGGDLFDSYGARGVDNTVIPIKLMKEYMGGELAATFGGDFLYSVGNHEGNIPGWTYATHEKYVDNYDPNAKIENYIVSDKGIYDSTVAFIEANNPYIVFDTDGIEKMKGMLTELGCTADEVAASEYMMKLHFHYDDTENKIRYIMLDTGANGMTQTNVLKSTYSNALNYQYHWFAETLLGTPSGYDVVVAGHQLIGPSVSSESGTSKVTYNPDGSVKAAVPGTATHIFNIISAFKTNGTVSTPDSSDASPYGKMLHTFRCDGFDFSDSEFNGMVFTVSGHEHSDTAWFVNDSNEGTNAVRHIHPEFKDATHSRAVLALVSGTASPGHKSSLESELNGYQISKEFPSNVRFDIVTITKKGVTCTRIGAGNDRTIIYGE